MRNEMTGDRYVNPYTDFGFKMLFGSEINKELLISFVNSLLGGREVIRDLKYLNTEHLGTSERDRRAVFDVYCENERGEKILVYIIGILNFRFTDENAYDYHHEVKLVDLNTHKVFYDKLTFIYLEMPKFNKAETELESMFDKWMFVIRNLSRLMDRPVALQERVFTRLFESAEIAKFTREQYEEYEDSLKAYRDWQNTIHTAVMKSLQEGIAQGREEGRKEERLKLARKFKASGIPVSIIAENTGLTEEEIADL